MRVRAVILLFFVVVVIFFCYMASVLSSAIFWIIQIIAGFRLLVLAKKDRKVFKLKQTNIC